MCFLAEVGEDGTLTAIRAVARGNRSAVLAAARDAAPGSVMLHNHPSGEMEPSDADLQVAARLYERGLGTAIVSPATGELHVVVEPPEPVVIEPLDVPAIEALVGPGGPLARLHPAWEERQGQREMVRLVTEHFNEGGILLVEAGTGTGKSLSYLLPAALWARENRQRTVISTATINLQEQLVSKDLPLARSVLGGELTWALAKGRGNYVSIRRAELAAGSAATLFPDDRGREIRAVVDWIGSTDDGSLSSLGFEPSPEVWEEVRSDSDACLRARCPHFQRCFYQRARRDAAQADLLVVNHHLLFSDLAVRRSAGNYTDAAVLPAYEHVILDEAHHVEESATAHLGAEVTSTGISRLFARFDRRGKGVLRALEELLEAEGGEEEDERLLARIEDRVRPRLEDARVAVDALLTDVRAWYGRVGDGPRRLGEGSGSDPVEVPALAERIEVALGALGGLRTEMDALADRMALREDPPLDLQGRLLDVQALVRRVDATRRAIGSVLDPEAADGPELVRWISVERSGRGPANVRLSAAPVDVGDGLRDSLWERARTIVLTSATLTTRAGFGYVRGRIGLEAEDLPTVTEACLPTPFDYPRQALFCVPTDLPAARGATGEFQEATARALRDLAGASGGGVVGLFTSHAALRRVAELLRDMGLDRQFPLFVHGEAPRPRLLEDFVAAGDGVLLGTSSFWEGIDVPGDPLRALLIQKLPFPPPNDPVTAARLEALERAGVDPFWALMVPHAALRLKQGFGRLIRARSDRGVVMLLDDRILTRRYGRHLLESLPPAPLVRGSLESIRLRIDDFYQADGILSGTRVSVD